MKIMLKYGFLLLAVLWFSAYSACTKKPRLADYACNKFSQYGEDGIIQKIFEIIGTTSTLCLEVGAGDGPGGSNVAHLWKNLGWRSLLIEGDQNKFRRLESSTKGYGNCTLVQSYIERDTTVGQTIDSIVQGLGVTERFDLVSLDVDGNDYYIFESLQLRPRVIIVEFNHTIPYYRDIYQEYSSTSWEIGCSVASLMRLGKQKGYELVAVTDVNAFFVDKIYFDLFKEYETAIECLFNTKYLKNIVHSYSGEPLLVAKINKLSDGFFKRGYKKSMHAQDCYVLRISEIDLNEDDLDQHWPGFSNS